ncbi:paraquat-inducible protein A [Pseudocolwellia agarivorans]|uniref:paraquat-inducible protein A n=1 Tax=Pseudocolwellia agarivorans TaxID=1911682 RepID=UPI000986A7CE|nr:paraquat-inducible protein A [Pseudocolwellia agarivorans]
MKKRHIACHDCDLLMLIPPLKHREKAKCPRCGYVLTRFYRHAQTKLLVSALTALIFLAFALSFPFIIFSLHGDEKTLTLLESIQNIENITYILISALLAFTAFIIPLSFLLCILYISLSFKTKKLLPFTNPILKLTVLLKPWNMAEIFIISILVSFIKVQTMAYIEFGYAFFFYLLFIMSLSATFIYFDRYQLWSLYQRKSKQNKEAA